MMKKKGFPESEEIVLCTVKRILHNSVFVDLDEYESKEGIIHISEISPGRIRTIREFVREGKKIVCKVLRINQVHGNIELSLRRVNMAQRVRKLNQEKLDVKCQKMVEMVAKDLGLRPEDVLEKVNVVVNEYGSLGEGFQEMVKGGEKGLTDLGVEKKVASKIDEIVKLRMKPPEVRVVKELRVVNGSAEGIEGIKESFRKMDEFAKGRKFDVEAVYIGGAGYKGSLVSEEDYKKANASLDEAVNVLRKEME